MSTARDGLIRQERGPFEKTAVSRQVVRKQTRRRASIDGKIDADAISCGDVASHLYRGGGLIDAFSGSAAARKAHLRTDRGIGGDRSFPGPLQDDRVSKNQSKSGPHRRRKGERERRINDRRKKSRHFSLPRTAKRPVRDFAVRVVPPQVTRNRATRAARLTAKRRSDCCAS